MNLWGSASFVQHTEECSQPTPKPFGSRERKDEFRFYKPSNPRQWAFCNLLVELSSFRLMWADKHLYTLYAMFEVVISYATYIRRYLWGRFTNIYSSSACLKDKYGCWHWQENGHQANNGVLRLSPCMQQTWWRTKHMRHSNKLSLQGSLRGETTSTWFPYRSKCLLKRIEEQFPGI